MQATPDVVVEGPDDAAWTVALAHGAGAGMHTRFMNAFASGLVGHGVRVARFEFPYMAAYRRTGKKKPPDRGADVAGNLAEGRAKVQTS